MKYTRYLFIAALPITYIAGCTSIVSGTDQTLTFNSEPDGATVIVSGKKVGKTPLSVRIDKGKQQSLIFEKEGYKTYTTQLSTTMDSWFWGNIILGGFLGSTTDSMSGAMDEFSPDQYFVSLTPVTPYNVSTSKPRKIKEIIIAFGDDIRLELANGGGENVDAIINLTDEENTNKEITVRVLQKLASKNTNDLDFAKSIIDFYEVK